MIEASHLRIGNILHATNNSNPQREDFDEIAVAVINHIDHVIRDGEDNIYNYRDLFPIPLTPELLKRLGATDPGYYDEDDEGYLRERFSLLDYRFVRTTGGWMQDFGSGVDGQHINYLHELQNRIFSLTGEELTVKG